MRILFPGLLFFLYSASVNAAELESVETNKVDDIYIVNLSILVDVPESYARSVLVDPDRFMAANPAIKKVEYLPQGENGNKRFRDTVHACALFFCVTYQNVMQLRTLKNHDIELIVEPTASDFEHGKVVWRTEALGDTFSRLSFYAENKPSFWTPPLIGTAIWQTRLASVVHETMRNVECDYHKITPCDIYPDLDIEDVDEAF